MRTLRHYDEDIRVSFDVDETLVKFGKDGKLVTHWGHIQALKEHYKRGHHVRVHSAGGRAWAEYVVTLLGLWPYVHEVTAKDSWVYDDKDPSEWLERIYKYQENFNNGQSFGSYADVRPSSQEPSTLSSTTNSGDNSLHHESEVESSGTRSEDQDSESRSRFSSRFTRKRATRE